jgi:spore germination protein KA
MEKLVKNSKEIINKIKNDFQDFPDLIIKTLTYSNTYLHLVFNETISERTTINKFILSFLEREPEEKIEEEDLLKYLKTKIPINNIKKTKSYQELTTFLTSGLTILIIDGFDEVLILETKAGLNSPISEAQLESTIKGPQDSFVENYQTNLGLIRSRIKDSNLKLKELIVGVRSQTKIGIMYIKDIVDLNMVQNVINKIESINIDAILDANYIIELISDNKYKTFANYLPTERPDRVCSSLLEGKIAIVLDNTPSVVLIPAIFVDFFRSPDDYYQKAINVNYTRIIRLIALFLTLFTPALYIAITTHNQEAIPQQLYISFATQKQGVPFPTVVEALIMLIIFEILKETDLRIPKNLGSALSIVGALVLGEAAVTAGLVSPIMIIVIAITAISGLIVSNMELVNGLRWWRLLFIFLVSFIGITGLLAGTFLFLTYLASIESFGISYLSPYTPINLKNQHDAFLLTNVAKFQERNVLTAKKNPLRGKDQKK